MPINEQQFLEMLDVKESTMSAEKNPFRAPTYTAQEYNELQQKYDKAIVTMDSLRTQLKEKPAWGTRMQIFLSVAFKYFLLFMWFLLSVSSICIGAWCLYHHQPDGWGFAVAIGIISFAILCAVVVN